MAEIRRRFTDEQLAKEAEREAEMRKRLYPTFSGGMTPQRSQQVAMMEEIAQVLRERCSQQTDLLGG